VFYCPVTKRFTQPGEKMFKIVTETRPRIYTETRINPETREKYEHELGIGSEIVREIGVSEAGYRILQRQAADKRVAEGMLPIG
jgi:hypothetical protein